MEQSLIKTKPRMIAKILDLISRGRIHTADQIAARFPLTKEQAIALLNDDEFYQMICSHTTAKLRMEYHTTGVQVLIDALRSESGKDKLAAFDRLAKLTGQMKEATPIHFNISLEDLLNEKEKKIKPGLNLVQRGNIFEAEGVTTESQEADFDIED